MQPDLYTGVYRRSAWRRPGASGADRDSAFDPARDVHIFFDAYALGEGPIEVPVWQVPAEA